ncbi:ABC transporter substrate-binding protein [Magnetospirillum sp. UT-4]|uniref:substrate-binding periplasmic protein n=1 Tax=Magnetospirillum sp. UT-4 TaxID=2681467 RepID=UPI0020C2F3D6|nr:transporter substrate-binding domain-containing protein [Magnetospirillum sp. UT-4]
MRVFIRGLFLLAMAWGGGGTAAAETVRVGGYPFPPFVEADGSGLARDLIDTLNKAQSDYVFTFVPVAARRRYGDLAEGRFDVMFFESPEWEWAEKGLPVDFTAIYLRGGEVFVARAQPGRGQDYFAELKGKSLVGILGYHYGFADFDADPGRLARDWNMKLVGSHSSSIDMVLAGRVDMAVVTDSYLWTYLGRTPEARRALLVSERLDQVYRHRALVRRGGPIAVATLDELLRRLDKDGTLPALWKRAGIVR